MAQIPTPTRLVLFHHAAEGLVDGLPKDVPAMILEVSGGPINTSSGDDGAGLQTDGVPPPPPEPVVCLLEVFRPRGTEWVRATEGDGTGQWSWPKHTGPTLREQVREMMDEYMIDLAVMLGTVPEGA